MIVDIHAYYFPKEYNDTLLRIGGRSLPEAARPTTARPMRNDDASGIATRLEQMAEAEVQMQVLSPAASPPYAEKEADAVAAARLINDAYAELARKYPGRFNAVVSAAAPLRRLAARDGAWAGPARHARRVDDLLLLRPLHRRSGVRAALPGDEPARGSVELPPDPERHLLAHDQRLRLHGLRR